MINNLLLPEVMSQALPFMTVPAHLRNLLCHVAREVQLSTEALQGTIPQIQAWSAIWGLTRSGNSLTASS